MSVSRDHYYRLASDLEPERIQAAVALINELTSVNVTTEWEYALSRLIKGLSSSRGSSRLGFSMCLTEIVQMRIKDGQLSLIDLLKMIEDETKVPNSANGKEERGILFGKLFGLQALSGLIGNADEAGFKKYVDLLIELGCTKSWIRESCIFTLFKLINALSGQQLKYIFAKIDEAGLSLTTEGLALYLGAPQQFTSNELQSLEFKNTTWKSLDPLKRENLGLLGKVLKDISTGDDEQDESAEGAKTNNKKKKGTWSPRLHFVWPILVSKLTETSTEQETEELEEVSLENSKKRKKSSDKKSKKAKKSTKTIDSDKIQIDEFFRSIIDETFFNEKASHERKYSGFEIFQLFYQTTPSSSTSTLFTKNFMRTLINQSSDASRLLNKIAKKTLTRIVAIATEDPSKVLPTITQLLTSEQGSLQFDKLTKSKTIESLLLIEDVSDLEIAQFFVKLLHENDQLKVKKWAIDQLLHLVRGKKTTLKNAKSLEWVDFVLKGIVQVAYFRIAGKESVVEKKETEEEEGEQEDKEKNNDEEDNEEQIKEDDSIIEFAQERLNSILSDVINIPRTDNQTWSVRTLTFIISLQEEGSKDSEMIPIFSFDEEISTVKDKSLKILKKIKSKRDTLTSSDHSSSKYLIFELLISMVLLQLYTGTSPDSVMTLQELIDYYYEAKNKTTQHDLDSGENLIGIIEILLNFVSQKSALLKKLSLIVWENFCASVNEEGLQLLVDVLLTKENTEGQKALFEGEDEFEEDDDEDEHSHGDDEEEEDEDEEEEEEEEESSDSDSESNEAETSTTTAINEVEKKTNVALAEALQIPYDGEVHFSSGDDSDYSSEESMDDEQMMEIDSQLSKIFKQRRDALDSVQTGNKRKNESIDAKANIVGFKNRVMDMLEVYIKVNDSTSEGANEAVISLISPLLNALKLTLDKGLGVRIHKLLKLKLCKIKTVRFVNVNSEDMISQLAMIHSNLLKSSHNLADFNLSSSQCSLFLAKQLVNLDEKNINEVIDLYGDLMKKWFKKKNSRVASSVFFDFVNWVNAKRGNQN